MSVHKEAWFSQNGSDKNFLPRPYTWEMLKEFSSANLLRLLERQEKRYLTQTTQEWWDEQNTIYDILVSRGVFEKDKEPADEDTLQRRIKWRQWYNEKKEKDPEWHARYLERVRNRQPSKKERKQKTKREVERQRERYQTDEGYAEKKREQAKLRHEEKKRRMLEDPEYAEEVRRKNREKARRSRERRGK